MRRRTLTAFVAGRGVLSAVSSATQMTKRGRLLAAFVLVVSLSAVPAAVGADPPTDIDPSAVQAANEALDATPTPEGTHLWFVELKSPPAVKGTSQEKLRDEKQAFRAAARDAGVSFAERFEFSRLWNGVSVQVDGPKDVSTISRLPEVKAVYPVLTASIPPVSTISPELATAITMTGADVAQQDGHTGDGVKVGVIDSGLDLDHPDLGGDGVAGAPHPNSRVVAQWDFVGDAFNAFFPDASYNPRPAPDPIADDCPVEGTAGGHGTHVSGIVGASPASAGGAKGVAPDVQFGAYRVFGCNGATTADIIVAALERALADGMDVVNMSIGAGFNTWAQYPTASASDNLVDAGVVVVASIGNSGESGVYSASAPGVGDKVIGVASFDNLNTQLPWLTVTPAGLTVGYTNAAGAPVAPTSGSLPLAKTGTPTSTADGCAPADLGNLTGKAVLIRRGTCGFYEKARRAQLAGASAVVLYNNVAGRINPTVAVGAGADGQPVTIPVVAVSDTEGVAINNAIVAGPQTLNWQSGTQTFPNSTSAGIISTFSSYGLGAELAVKPDIGAPGGFIRSTYPLEREGGYRNLNGTSMSSPHVAGAVAQLLEARPGTTPADVRALLQNSADPRPFAVGQTALDNVHRQGAGMLDIDDSISAPVLVTPGKIALGEAGPPLVQTLTLKNSSASAVTYNLSHQAARSTFGSTFAPSQTTTGVTGLGDAVTFSPASVLVPAGGTATVDVTIPRPNFDPFRLVYGGWIVLTPQGDGQVLRVPYAGYGGDYQGFPVMNGLPQWDEVQTVAITGGPTGGTFTLTFTPPSGGAAQTTAAIPHNATAAQVRTALAALPGIGGTANVLTSGGPLPGTAVNVTFTGALGAQDIAQMTATSSLTGGTSPAVTVATARQGQASFPKLAKRVGFVSATNFTPTYSFPSTKPTYTLKRTNIFGREVLDVPTVGVHLDHQVRWLKLTVLTAAGQPVNSGNPNATVNSVMQFDFLPRNSTAGGFFVFEWDGRLTRTLPGGNDHGWAVPQGDYRFKVEILKAGGDEANAAHKESYTSPVFTLDRSR